MPKLVKGSGKKTTEGQPDQVDRPRRKRPKGWLQKAIATGAVRDPELGPNPVESHSPDATVVDAPKLDFNVTGESDGDR